MDRTRGTRRKLPKAASLGVTAIGILTCVLAFEGSSRRQLLATAPNVILVMTDDQGYGDLACTGNPWIKTPNIDHFYQDAVRYTDFHVQPLCTPTRGAMMTATGHWFVNVEDQGQYKVTLRRWPEELGLGINQVISDEQANDLIFWNWRNAKRRVKALHPNHAQLKIGESTYEQAIDADEPSATFLIAIEQTGPCYLEAWFLKDSEVITSAYFVDVERLAKGGQ